MPEYIVVLVLATAIFVIAYRPACVFTDAEDFTRRRNLWFALTLAIFLAPNFWVYTFIAIPLLIYANKRELNAPALYFFILFVVPPGIAIIPGMGIIEYLFVLSHAKLLALFILLPAFFSLVRQTDTLSFGRTWPDKALAAYLLLTAALYLRETSVTDTLRQTFYLFIDILLPYFVISRSLRNLQAFRDALLSFVLATLILALIAVFEISRHWLLYRDLPGKLGLEGMNAQGGYLLRDEMVRASASIGQPIALGFVIAVGIGLYLYLQRSIQQKFVRRLGMVLLVGGLIAALSRGPWVGAAVLLLVFVATGHNPARRSILLALLSALTFFIISALPGGEKVINLLPYIGTTEERNVEGREILFTNSMIVIQRYPWFGSTNYLETPEMQALKAYGGGFVDVVNTYVRIALESGFVGLGLFTSFFALTLMGIYRAMRSISDRGSEEHLLGRVLLATLLAIMVIITTVSSIAYIPIVYWSVAGMGVAYARLIWKQAGK